MKGKDRIGGTYFPLNHDYGRKVRSHLFSSYCHRKSLGKVSAAQHHEAAPRAVTWLAGCLKGPLDASQWDSGNCNILIRQM